MKFRRESEYLGGLLEARDALVAGAVPFDNPFLDDVLGGIYPDDLVVYGAGTGVGKTTLVTQAVKSALDAGCDPVHLFALEATEGEITARLGFEELGLRSDRRLDFADFWRGRCREEEELHWGSIQEELRPLLERLHTYYKGTGSFTNHDLNKLLEQIGDVTKFVALDHLHVVDSIPGKENSTQGKTAGLLRDFALVKQKPVVTASHLRKAQDIDKGRIVPEKDDLLGSKIISGVATVIVMVARDWDSERPQPHLSPTFFAIDKDRRGRASPHVARIYFDTSTGRYQDTYTLGRARWPSKGRKQVWDPVPAQYVPEWMTRETRNKEARPF